MTPTPPCPEHNVRDCLTCHTEPGECEFAGRECGQPATHTLAHPRDTRRFCEHHATAPEYAAMRIGYTVEKSDR